MGLAHTYPSQGNIAEGVTPVYMCLAILYKYQCNCHMLAVQIDNNIYKLPETLICMHVAYYKMLTGLMDLQTGNASNLGDSLYSSYFPTQ